MKLHSVIQSIEYKLGNYRGKIIFRGFGKNSTVIQPKRIINGKYVTIGNDCFINYGLRMECISQYEDSKFNPEIKVGNNVNIEQNVHITCGESIVIGDDCSILADVLITDITHPYENINMAPKYQQIQTKPVVIGPQTMIGMGARILPGVTIGTHCVIGTNCVVTKNVPDYSVVTGIPAKIVKKYNFNTGKWEK